MLKQKKNRTTAEHFRIFVEECRYWINYFGLVEYGYKFFHDKINGLACTNMNSDRWQRCCSLSLSTNWEDNPITDYFLRMDAFHEVCEVMLWKIGDYMAQEVGLHKERDLTHEVIRRLESSVFQESYNRRFGNVERTSTANTKRKARSRSGKKRS